MTELVQHPPPPSTPPPPLGQSVPKAEHPSASELVALYQHMLLSRRLETRVIELYRQNQITGGVYTGHGNEATSVGTAFAMAKDDVLVPTHRDMGSHLVRGHTAEEIMLQYLKRKASQTGGKDSGLHIGREGSNIVGMISHLAHMMPVAVGVALAERQKGTNAAVLTSVGEGASSLGDFHEALNFAAVARLPVLFVIVNNQYAYSTPRTFQYAAERLSDRAIGYGMKGETIDGTDVITALAAARRAFARGRKGEGPTLLESLTMRMRGHSEHDDMKYVPKPLVEAWKAWDPVERLERHLLEQKISGPAEIEREKAAVEECLDRAVKTALDAAPPDGPEAVEGVYRRWSPEWTPPTGAARLANEGGGS
ncbi:MAG: thiamine pyrophosphate-dependent dehydrogenase E1 component subunit alpha [Myxococcota bacterium]